MQLTRVLRHLATGSLAVRRNFSQSALTTIETAVREGETEHSGEIRFAVEAALPLAPLLRGQTARERAIEVFSQLRVWDTERNNGVLIYLLLADHDVEIVADRGIHAKVGTEGWELVCRRMEAEFRAGRFEAGALAGIRAVSALLQQHFPDVSNIPDELPNQPVIL
ncbi:MAG: TPM domain-containing protein [Nevskiales bacterium]